MWIEIHVEGLRGRSCRGAGLRAHVGDSTPSLQIWCIFALVLPRPAEIVESIPILPGYRYRSRISRDVDGHFGREHLVLPIVQKASACHQEIGPMEGRYS